MTPDPRETPPPRRRAGEWWIVWFQSGVVAALIAGAVLTAVKAKAATSTIGQTWPIVEPDALAEIEARAARQPPSMAKAFGPRSGWSALRAAPLAAVRTNRVRSVVPFYRLDFDVALPGGKVLYPKGYTFNPLAYVALPQRLFIIHPRDLAWALQTASLTDWILLAAGPSGPGTAPLDDAISLAEKVGRPLFILEERVKQRLGLRAAPVIVRQVGQRLELTEVDLSRSVGRARP